MKYSEARDTIKSGDLIFLTHRKWSSWYDIKVQLVRFFTASEYCHAAIAWCIGGRVFIIESVVPLVRIVPLSTLADDGFYFAPSKISMSSAEMEFALSKVGTGKYSQIRAVLAQLIGIKIGDGQFLECAEFVIACRRLSGADLGDKATPSAVAQAALISGSAINFVSKD